ncbi:LysR family transcriptional regulator [Mesorhizobium captivum]|uniref:LysR family transcriptional regulator n=1 Tax=Mesorhizobium captivum TaxID=3072319 RepID=UPI002A23B2B8|nr:LysR family transcriptional regulator [Mesorhizobium sp. VK3C]MDX8444757.1 LysR family transcriptional regulator [Mesorhizobium sp. VK3C]
MGIDHANLARLDLNLLVALDALLAERSVTRAAARVGLGQSAMSYNLGRLRELFRDELLVRSADGMRPTPKALALATPVRAVLTGVATIALEQRGFEPATAERRFRIAIPDSLESTLLPRLLGALAAEAPSIAVQVRSTDRFAVLDLLDRGELDLGIGVFTEGDTTHKRRVLYPEGYLCLYPPDLVQVSAPITLNEYVSLPHVLASSREDPRGVVDDALALLGQRRRVLLSTPHFLAIPHLLRPVGAIATLPAALAQSFVQQFQLATSKLPFDLPSFQVSMLWHASYDRDPAHRWLREKIAGVVPSINSMDRLV